MSLKTYSKFYYGHTVSDQNNTIDFEEGGDPKTATIAIGSYTLTKYLEAVANAINAALAADVVVSIDRATRIVTLTFSAPVDLLGLTGPTVASNALGMLGIAEADFLADTAIVGTLPSGYEWAPQLMMQNHIPPEHSFRAASATVNKSASGRVQVQSFGSESFLKGKFTFITNIQQPADSPIRSNSSAVEEMIEFFTYAITKAPLEFIKDENDPDDFIRILLESTSTAQDGTGFEPKELYTQGLAFYYDTGSLVFRVIEED